MMNATTLHNQYEQAQNDELKTLIVGAGIAGITAAQMLRKDGKHPVLIEKHKGNLHPGYMLALMPMVDAVLEELGLREEYRKRSNPFSRYGLHSHTGKMIRIDEIGALLAHYGDYRGISRGELITTLTSEGCPVTFDTVVTEMKTNNTPVEVCFRSEDQECTMDFDLVIIADGIHSQTRQLLPGDLSVDTINTHWGGWVVWASEDNQMDMGEELWGRDFFLGVYPVKGRLGVFLGGNLEDTRQGPKAFVSAVRKELNTINSRIERCLQAIETAEDPYFWPLDDCQCARWASGNTLLLGDAAAGFLPTAGIGAGMAMESAWVLTRMLRYADKNTLAPLLAAYEKAQKPRVEAAQQASRSLARMMFTKSSLVAWLRDLIMRFMSVSVALKPILKLIAHPPQPDRTARECLG